MAMTSWRWMDRFTDFNASTKPRLPHRCPSSRSKSGGVLEFPHGVGSFYHSSPGTGHWLTSLQTEELGGAYAPPSAQLSSGIGMTLSTSMGANGIREQHALQRFIERLSEYVAGHGQLAAESTMTSGSALMHRSAAT